MRFLCFSVIQYLFSCLGKISERRDFLILNFKNDLKIKLSDKDISFLSCIHFASHIQEPCVLWMRIVAKAIKWVFMSLTKACPAKILANKCIRSCSPHKSIYEYFTSEADIIGFSWSCFFRRPLMQSSQAMNATPKKDSNGNGYDTVCHADGKGNDMMYWNAIVMVW